jgi:hypothetical protein
VSWTLFAERDEYGEWRVAVAERIGSQASVEERGGGLTSKPPGRPRASSVRSYLPASLWSAQTSSPDVQHARSPTASGQLGELASLEADRRLVGTREEPPAVQAVRRL